MNKEIKKIEKCEEEFLSLFATKKVISRNLYRYEDDIIFDMYDHNYFVYNEKTSLEELLNAQSLQYSRHNDYLKFMADEKMNTDYIKTMKLQESCFLTMLFKGNVEQLAINEKVQIKDITLRDLNNIEVKHYGKNYGEAFCKRRNKEYLKKAKELDNFNYYGTYLENKIVGSAYAYTFGDYTCIDSLLVDRYYRHRKIATTLLKYMIIQNKNVYLHADEDDTPKNMYEKMGFVTVKRTYEYFKKLPIIKK